MRRGDDNVVDHQRAGLQPDVVTGDADDALHEKKPMPKRVTDDREVVPSGLPNPIRDTAHEEVLPPFEGWLHAVPAHDEPSHRYRRLVPSAAAAFAASALPHIFPLSF